MPVFHENRLSRRMEPLNMVGGGAESALWCHIFADVLDCEVRQVDCPEMANARGAAFLASIGLGLFRRLNGDM